MSTYCRHSRAPTGGFQVAAKPVGRVRARARMRPGRTPASRIGTGLTGPGAAPTDPDWPDLESALPFLSLAHGILGDRAAVEVALTLPWSNGSVDGHVHRVE